MCGCKLYLALPLDEGLDHLFGDSRGRRVHVHPLGKVTRTSSETHLLTHSYDDDGDCDYDDDDDDDDNDVDDYVDDVDDDDEDDDDDDDYDDDVVIMMMSIGEFHCLS